MLVTINDILLDWPNGTDQSIFGGSNSEVFQACINPNAAGLVALPYKYSQTFQAYVGGEPPDGKSEARSLGLNYFTMVYNATNV